MLSYLLSLEQIFIVNSQECTITTTATITTTYFFLMFIYANIFLYLLGEIAKVSFVVFGRDIFFIEAVLFHPLTSVLIDILQIIYTKEKFVELFVIENLYNFYRFSSHFVFFILFVHNFAFMQMYIWYIIDM